MTLSERALFVDLCCLHLFFNKILNKNLLLDHFLSMYNVFVWSFNDWLHRITACPFRPQPQEKHLQMSQNRKKRQHSIKDKRKVSPISSLSLSLSSHRTQILGAKLVQEMFPLVFLWLGSGLVLLNSQWQLSWFSGVMDNYRQSVAHSLGVREWANV